MGQYEDAVDALKACDEAVAGIDSQIAWRQQELEALQGQRAAALRRRALLQSTLAPVIAELEKGG